jgi:hypothetical protein
MPALPRYVKQSVFEGDIDNRLLIQLAGQRPELRGQQCPQQRWIAGFGDGHYFNSGSGSSGSGSSSSDGDSDSDSSDEPNDSFEDEDDINHYVDIDDAHYAFYADY